jgi:hypothetical protein
MTAAGSRCFLPFVRPPDCDVGNKKENGQKQLGQSHAAVVDHLELALADFVEEVAMHAVDQSTADQEEDEPDDQYNNCENDTLQ